MAFALLGDVPYSQPQANLLDAMIDRMNAEPLAFVVHVGDITSGSGPCGDEWLEARSRQFARFKAPFVLLPGDNEWTDCRKSGFDPAERLQKWRSLFCVGGGSLPLERQKGKYCENVRWVHDNVVFAGVNIPGGNNNLRDAAENAERMKAVFAWLDEAEALARKRDGLVILMHANPLLTHRFGTEGYAPVRERLARLGREMPGKVLLVHGDTHRFRDDEPLPGLRRTEVFGWPWLRWTRARIERKGASLFSVELARE
ncbi:MAG: metallophosphoesterase [Candidatus Parcubacteria bacterium]|nr:metallophosphoesterase [Burkholderiales bacterium]